MIVVCVHGALDRGASFSRLRRRLPEHTVITYDRRGYAASIDTPAAIDFSRQVADLAAIVADQEVIVVGHSFGGLIALRFAAEFPAAVSAALVYEPPLAWLPWWPPSPVAGHGGEVHPEEAAERFFRDVVGDQAWDRLDDETRSLRRREGAALVADLSSTLAAPAFDPAAVAAPVVVARGERAEPHHVRGAAELARWLHEGRPQVIAGAAHGAHISHPDSFAGLVQRAVERAAG